jgi:hypothetical protein
MGKTLLKPGKTTVRDGDMAHDPADHSPVLRDVTLSLGGRQSWLRYTNRAGPPNYTDRTRG